MPRAFHEEERAQIRATLLDVARHHAERGGLRRVPVDDLVRAAGISKGAFYLFFESKEALLVAMLAQVETELRQRMRAALLAPDPLQAVLTTMFDGVTEHPLLHLLTDPAELAWLVRALPPGHLDAARADDDRFAEELLRELISRGLAREDADADTFAGLSGVALAVSSQAHLIGEARAPRVRQLVVEALVARLRPSS